MHLDWPLMKGNIARADLDAVIEYLKQDDPILTHRTRVEAFEREWSEWLGVKHSVLVNSGSSANLLSLTALREFRGDGEIIVPPLTWVSDVAAVLQCGFTPVFADVNPRTLGLDTDRVLEKLTLNTRAVFITHILGFNALTERLVAELADRNIPLIEDACEAHGATFNGHKVGSIGWMSNFSFYYAHHMSTVEGGIISTNDHDLYQLLRVLRSHGLVREATTEDFKQRYWERFPDLNPTFIFALPAYNARPTEITGIIGSSQIRRLDANNAIRTENLRLFLDHLDPELFQTDFAIEGSCNYAFALILQHPDPVLWALVEQTLRASGVEFRRGLSGGGNQLRQPYLRARFADELDKYPISDHVHFYGCYIGNYPELDRQKIVALCGLLNELKEVRCA